MVEPVKPNLLHPHNAVCVCERPHTCLSKLCVSSECFEDLSCARKLVHAYNGFSKRSTGGVGAERSAPSPPPFRRLPLRVSLFLVLYSSLLFSRVLGGLGTEKQRYFEEACAPQRTLCFPLLNPLEP
jgi:hypothetical protein